MEELLKTIKIYKSATQKSIIDFTPALMFFKNKENGERDYKGSIVISISDLTNKQYLKFFLSKETTKVVFNAFINGSFDYIFPNGLTEYGGSEVNGQIRARILKIWRTPKNQLAFKIEEGSGKRGSNGSIQMIRQENSAQSYIPFVEALKACHEVLSFIEQAEILGFFRGQPLYSRNTYQNYAIMNQQQMMQNTSNQNMMQNQYSPPNQNMIPNSNMALSNQNGLSNTNQYVQNNSTAVSSQNQEYIIKIGPLAGTSIKNVESDTLAAIAEELKKVDLSNNPDAEELFYQIINELKLRMN